MFSYLPALLSGAWQQLPAYAALSGALQRRVLAYLLRRALGRFLAPGALDAASIDAAIGSGSVEIAGLQLSAEVINELLPRGPLRVVSGQLGRVSVQLPFPNLWSGELSLALSDIDVRVALDGNVSPPASPFGSPRASRSSAGLEESILGAAESVFHDTLEGQELEESLQASMLDAQSAAAGTPAAAAPDAPAPGSLISGIVEGLLARLKVSVRRVSLQLQHAQHVSVASGVQLELRLESFDLQTEASAPAAAHPAGLQDRLVQEVVRTARVAGVSLWMTLPAEAATVRTRQASWRGAGSSESDSSDSDSEMNEYMEMSSAIPDLRQSSVLGGAGSALGASQASVYASAEDIRGLDVSETRARPASTASAAQVESGPEMLLSLGNEPIVVRFMTLKEVPRPAADSFAAHGQDDDEEEPREHEEIVVALPAARLRSALSVEVGAVVAFIHPRQLAALLSMAGELGSSSSAPQDDGQPAPARPARAAFDASLRVAALHVVCAYEPPRQLSLPSRQAMHESLQAFWQRPARVHPAVGHLRLRVEGVDLEYAVAAAAEASPTARALVADVGVYEHLSPDLANSEVATVFPILLPDANMPEQYDVPLAGTPSGLDGKRPALVPLEQVSMDAADWRLAAGEQRAAPSATSEASRTSSQGPYWRASWGERAWKVRPRVRRASSSVSAAAKDPAHPALRIDVRMLSGGASTTVELAPLHLFVDVSTANRLMPLAQSASAALRQNAWSSARSDLSQSFATLTASPKIKSAPLQGYAVASSASRTELRCALLRVELRVPSAAAGPRTSELRSGILIVDVRGIDARLGAPSADKLPHRASVGFASEPSHTRQRAAAVAEDGRCSIGAMVAFFKPTRETRATAFAVVGKLAADDAAFAPGEEEPRPLTVRLLRRPGAAAAKPRSSIDVQLPAVRTSLSKALLDQLELLADDLSQWSAALGRETDIDDIDGGADALKILGSRFFGTKHSISALSGSSDSTELARKGDSAPALALSISEVSVSLHIPRADSPKDLHHLEASASEVALFVDPAHAELTTLIDLSIMDVVVKSRADDSATTFLSRTLEQSLASGGIAMISLHLLSIAEADTSYRESKIDVALRGFTVAASPSDAALLSDLLRFLQSPEGAFEHVEPNEVTRLSLRVRDVSLVVSAPRASAQAAAVIGELSLKAKLSPYSRRTTYKFALRDSAMLLAERATAPSEDKRRKIRTPLDHWAACGFASLVDLADAKGSLTLSTLTRPEVDVKVSLLRIEVTACADTLSVAAELSRALTPVAETPASSSDSFEQSAPGGSAPVPGLREPDGRDMLASLDEDAFRRSSQSAVLASSADLVEDDIPRNASYLGAAPASPSILSAALEDDDLLGSGSIETLDIAPSVAQSANVVLQNDVVTVRLLDPRGICPKPHYFTDPLLEPHVAQTSPFASSVRIRVADCDVALRLFAGYDWEATRQAIETEARRVRRRLQKIQQLLDEGQTPDDSVEAITGALFDSIHISLPAAQSELDVGAAMKAMDDELGDQSETASNASTWQPLPSGAGVRPPVHGPASRRRSKLQRSAKSMIDIELKGIEAEFDAFGRTSPTASRLAVAARSLQILDNIPTSTWRTFLTEMLPENRAFRRNDEARMLRLEVHTVRPQLGQAPPREEVRVRAKLAPLRLHVDQDALDFFKKFFAFKTPGGEAEPTSAPAPASGPFIQHAEIFPIRLKLDYKPKRVDYGLLREGRTVELMNFFHFDEAEMTLRHVTMRGITGWARLFDTLNDLWTPDVKANQLADVLSGIAPVRSLVNVGAGLADLVLLPLEQYQRDGRLARGLQRGASSFAKTTALEAVRLGAKLATGTQVILEQAEHVLGGRMSAPISAEAVAARDVDDAGAAVLDDEERTSLISRYAEQPEDMRDALAQAYSGLSRGLSSAARTILAVPMEVHERSAGAGASALVIRAVPIAVLRGAAGASEALSKTLQGLQRELDGAPQLSEDKYKARKPAPRRGE